jgi:hypothetical protein
MSYTYLQEQGEESSAECFSDIPQYVLSRLNLTAEKSCSNGNETESCQSSQSGMMYAPSMAIRGEEKSMSFAEGSLARISAQPVRVLESKANEADSGKRWQGLLVKYDQDMFSSKTVLCSEQEDSALFSKTLPKWGMMQDGECLERTMSEHLTKDNESGLWPTPQRVDYKGTSRDSAFQQRAAQYNLWSMGQREHSTIYPSPTAYEAIMGWPMQWTELKPLEMGKFQRWLDLHGMS